MTAYGHNARAGNDWYRELISDPDDKSAEVSTFDLVRRGLLVSDDTADMALWRSLRDADVPMTLSAEEWGDVEHP